MSSVRFEKVAKSFATVSVIQPLDLTIAPGEFLSLLGPSGCGKTTLLRMVAGLESPTAGRIWIGNELASDPQNRHQLPPEKRGLAMVFQSYALWPHMTVLENVAFSLKLRGISRDAREAKARTVLESVRLGDLSARRPSQLSGGQQQRVALARALAAEPKVMLLDEPLSNLDANLRDEMCDEIRDLRKTFPMTMIYVTHDQNEAFRLSDRIAIMNKGVLEQLASPSEIQEAPASEFVRNFLRRR